MFTKAQGTLKYGLFLLLSSHSYKNPSVKEWMAQWMTKSAGCSCRRPAQTLHIPGDPMLSCDLHRHQVHTLYTYMRAKHSHIKMIKSKKEVELNYEFEHFFFMLKVHLHPEFIFLQFSFQFIPEFFLLVYIMGFVS